MKLRLLCLSFVLAGVVPALAGQALSVRLVAASNEPGGVAPELADVAGLLKRNMPFASYRLVDAKTVALPATGTTQAMRLGYAIACTGAADNLQVAVSRGDEELLRTTASLQPGTPLILGGFASGQGRLFLILLLR